MEALIKLPGEAITDDGIIRAKHGYVRFDALPFAVNPRGRYWGIRVGKIYGVYEGPGGGRDLYIAYSVDKVSELIHIADIVAPRPAGELKPIAAKVRNLVGARCGDMDADDVIDVDCQPRYEFLEIPQRELPAELVTKENLREVLIRNLDLRTALYYDALRHVAYSTLRLVPLCDESGELALSEYEFVYYCRVGDRAFVKKWLSEPFYEVPKEWLQGLEVKERSEHPGAEELRRIFGLEADARQLINYIARGLGLAEEQRYVHTAKYCIAPSMELSRHRQLVAEPYGGIVKVFRDYRLYYGDGDCTDVPSPYGVYTVVCTMLQQYECEAWRIRDIGPEEPPKVVAECIEDCECSHTLLEQMPEERRGEVLKILEERLRSLLDRGREFERVKCFPLEVFSRALGPVASYEEAEAKWRQAVEEIEKKKEEERRRFEEERRRRREEKKREVLARVKKLGLPLKVDVRDHAVYVAFARRLPNDEFQRAIKALKELGFKFDWRDKVWYYEL